MHKIRRFIEEEKLSRTVSRIAQELNNFYGNEEVILCVVMKGSLIFAADLMRALTMPVQIEFMQAKSYGTGTTSSGKIHIRVDMGCDIQGRNVLIVEDIIDSGNTLYALKNTLSARGPKSLKLCTLLDKPSRREAPVNADFCGITIPDAFVVGYGLDYAEHYRELPYIGIVEMEE